MQIFLKDFWILKNNVLNLRIITDLAYEKSKKDTIFNSNISISGM